MFLVYSSVFRNYSDPLAVAKYYFECIKNREGYLTYPISKQTFFNDDGSGKIYEAYKLKDVIKMQPLLMDEGNNKASVNVKFYYKDNAIGYANVALEEEDDVWLIERLD
jgi:hypothetical protein